MPRFSANLAYLFTELPFMERFAAAAETGFKAVEIQFPYPYPAENIKKELLKHNLVAELINMPAGDWEGGERGLAVLPERREDDFRNSVDLAMKYADILDVYKLNCLAGIPAEREDDSSIAKRVAGRLAYAADKMAASKRTLLVEGINNHDMPGFWMNSIHRAREVVAGLGKPNLFYQFDIYHAGRMGLDIGRSIEGNFDFIGHFQLADVPGRNQPGTGELNFRDLFTLIDRRGYPGFIGLEYIPLPDLRTSLNWIAEYKYSL